MGKRVSSMSHLGRSYAVCSSLCIYIPTHLLPFSSRSVLQASDMPEKKRKLLLNVFKKFKQKFIWKWETEQMEGLPSNVKLSKWLPQQDILAHPNTKMFITHAGQSSTQETLCHKTPVVSAQSNQLGNFVINSML